jgi:ABC-type multidrug transport system fused ATPase/permease subunit
MAFRHTRDAVGILRSALDRNACAGIGVVAALSLAGGVLSATVPIALAALIDSLVPPAGRPEEALMTYVAVMLLARLTEQGQVLVLSRTDQKIQERAAAAAFQHLVDLPVREHLTRAIGGNLQILQQALQGLRLIVMQACLVMLPTCAQLAMMLVVVAAVFDTGAWFMLVLVIGAYGMVFWRGQRLQRQPLATALGAQTGASELRADALANIEAIKNSNAGAAIAASHQRRLSVERAAWSTMHGLRAGTGSGVALVFALGLLSVLGMGLAMLREGRCTLGEFVLLNAYMLQVARPVELAGFALRDIAQGIAYLSGWIALKQVSSEADQQSPTARDGEPRDHQRPAGGIVFDDVTFAYAPGRTILENLSLTVPPGCAAAIVGSSGSGKSTLIRLLLGHYKPCEGRIWIGPTCLEDYALADLRRMIAVVSQDTILLNDTLRANLVLARPEASEGAIAAALSQAGLRDTLARLADGVDTRVGERGAILSGGERQRVAIARAILQDAPFLLLDEATSALDPATEEQICESLAGVCRGRTTLVMTHRPAMAALADRVHVLARGRIVEAGDHRELMRGDGVYARMWRTPASLSAASAGMGQENPILTETEAFPSRHGVNNDHG